LLKKFRRSLTPFSKREKSTGALVLSTVLTVEAVLVSRPLLLMWGLHLSFGEWLASVLLLATLLFLYLNDAIEVEPSTAHPRAAIELRVPEDLDTLGVGDFLENQLRHEDEARHV